MKSGTRALPKSERVRDVKEVPNAQREAVLKQIGDGGNDGNVLNGKSIKK